MCVSVITLYISYFMLYIYNIEERHKHHDFKLPRAPNWQLVGGLGRVDIRKGSDMYFDTRNMLK